MSMTGARQEEVKSRAGALFLANISPNAVFHEHEQSTSRAGVEQQQDRSRARVWQE